MTPTRGSSPARNHPKRGGKKQQKRKLNKQIRAAQATANAPSLSEPAVVASDQGLGNRANAVPILQTPVPPLHKSLRAQTSSPPAIPMKNSAPSNGQSRRVKQQQPKVKQSPQSRPDQAKSDASRPRASPSSSYTAADILQSILNPRAAVYQFQARYHQDPLSSLTTTANNTPLITPRLLPALTLSPQPKSAVPPLHLLQQQPRQLYDAILVVDVEATCASGSTFDYPNEIIEWPVLLMRWEEDGTEQRLVVVDEFRSYVRPTWRPHLTDFCRSLTGINQGDIDTAPTFPEMLTSFELWLQKHGLIAPPTALLTPPSSRCPSPIQMQVPPTPGLPEPSGSLFDCPPPAGAGTPDGSPSISPACSVPSSALSTTSSSSLGGSGSQESSRSNRSSFTAATAVSMHSPTMSCKGLFSPSHQPMALPLDGDDRDTEWDSMSGYEYHAQSSFSGPRFAWATDGPCDLRDFLVKQCYISKIPIPEYFLGDVIDVRRIVGSWVDTTPSAASPQVPTKPINGRPAWQRHGKRQSLNLPQQLQALSLGSFSGQLHRGIDDARNISRILQALNAKGITLEGNMYVNPNRRWFWMGGDGEIVLPPSSGVASVVPCLPPIPATPI